MTAFQALVATRGQWRPVSPGGGAGGRGGAPRGGLRGAGGRPGGPTPAPEAA